jgi:hypothetical protein
MLELLGIDPKDTDIVKAISLELEALENYGMIISNARGWRWIG